MSSEQQPSLPLIQGAQAATEEVEQDIVNIVGQHAMNVGHYLQADPSQLAIVQQDSGGATGVAAIQDTIQHPGAIPRPDDPSTRPPPAKKQRRRYDNNFKACVLDHLKGSNAKLSVVAKQYGIPENTLREWTKVSVVQSIEAARLKSNGTLKANMYDPLHRLADSVLQFFAENEKQLSGIKRPVTTKLIVAKGMEARKRLLELHAVNNDYLEPREKKALEAFTGSDSWAKKFSKRHNLKLNGSRAKGLTEGDVRAYSEQLTQMVQRLKQAGPAYKEVTALLFRANSKLEMAGTIQQAQL